MEDKWKVYIKGVPSRGTEVINALEDLGGNNLYSYGGEDDAADYYINPNGIICCAYTKGNAVYPFLMEFYKEIKLPEVKNWKDGTLLIRSFLGNKEYVVCSDKKAKFDDEIVSYVYADDNVYGTNVICESRNFKVASKDDINDFQKLLHQYGKDWSFKYKILSDWKFEPENNEEYWYINDVGEICHTLFNNFLICDLKRARIGNCFQTKLGAFKARDKIAKIMHPGKPTV